jgi:hypothetical protein
LPSDNSMTVSPVDWKVKAVTWMNCSKQLHFTQRGTSTDRTITIDIENVSADPVDTIVKIELERPLPGATPPPVRVSIPTGNLASFKPARNLSFDGRRGLQSSAQQFASKGVDGLSTTAAAAAEEWAWTYQVDLGRLYQIDTVVVHFANNGYASEYKICTSDDGDEWITVTHVSDNSRGGAHPHTFPISAAQYVRIQAIKPDGPDQPGAQMTIVELEAYESKTNSRSGDRR